MSRQHLCEECDKVFYGCKVFEGYIRILNVCSEECYTKNGRIDPDQIDERDYQ